MNLRESSWVRERVEESGHIPLGELRPNVHMDTRGPSQALHVPHVPPRLTLTSLMSGPEASGLLEIAEDSELWSVWEEVLLSPTRDFLSNPGKSLRRDFVQLGWQLAWLMRHQEVHVTSARQLRGLVPECPVELPLLIELLHAGSLVIDDIEDQSEMRRGAACLHQKIGIAPALNIGNWLYFVSGSMIERLDCDERARVRLYKMLNRVMLRCHQGQSLDVSCRVTSVDRSKIAALTEMSTRLKTGVLLGFSLQMSALYLGASAEESTPLYEFGERVGLGLQMYDDLSGISNPKRWHKGCEDLSRARLTWVWSWVSQNPELSHDEFSSLITELTALSQDPSAKVSELINDPRWLERAQALRDQCLWWIDGARDEVVAQLDAALASLDRQLASPSVTWIAESTLSRLKSSYL